MRCVSFLSIVSLAGFVLILPACTTGRATGPVTFSQSKGGNTAASDFVGMTMARRQTAKVIAMRQAAEHNSATAAVADKP